MSWHKIKRDPADIEFSKYIRLKANWTCEACYKYLGEGGGEASHFHGRRKESVRFDPDNVACHCHSCHRHFTEQPEEHRAWKLKQLGQRRFDALNVRSELYCKKDRKLALLIAKRLHSEEKEKALSKTFR
jgi:hypothetical protein